MIGVRGLRLRLLLLLPMSAEKGFVVVVGCDWRFICLGPGVRGLGWKENRDGWKLFGSAPAVYICGWVFVNGVFGNGCLERELGWGGYTLTSHGRE